MNMPKPKITVIDKQGEDGIYVWKTPEGKIVTDGEGNTMNIPARRGDITAISKITEAAAYYGFPEGEAVFRAGQRRITDEEYSEQLDRMSQGLIPSETDLGAWYDAAKGIKAHGE